MHNWSLKEIYIVLCLSYLLLLLLKCRWLDYVFSLADWMWWHFHLNNKTASQTGCWNIASCSISYMLTPFSIRSQLLDTVRFDMRCHLCSMKCAETDIYNWWNVCSHTNRRVDDNNGDGDKAYNNVDNCVCVCEIHISLP